MHNNNNNFFIGYRFKINVRNYTKLEIIFITRKISQIIYTKGANLRSLHFSICAEFIARQQDKRPQGLR